MKISWRGDDGVLIRVYLKSIDLGNNWVHLFGKNPWRRHNLISCWCKFFLDNVGARPEVLKFARQIFCRRWCEKINFVSWTKGAKRALVIFTPAIDSVAEMRAREKISSLFLSGANKEVVSGIVELALAMVETSEKKIETGGGIPSKDDLKR